MVGAGSLSTCRISMYLGPASAPRLATLDSYHASPGRRVLQPLQASDKVEIVPAAVICGSYSAARVREVKGRWCQMFCPYLKAWKRNGTWKMFT